MSKYVEKAEGKKLQEHDKIKAPGRVEGQDELRENKRIHERWRRRKLKRRWRRKGPTSGLLRDRQIRTCL